MADHMSSEHLIGCVGMRSAGVKDAVPGLDEGVADGAQDVAFARARVADSDEIGTCLDPVACGQRLDAGPGPRRTTP